MLGAFVTPSLAVAGAAAVSLPILIHLLARRRFKRIRWAAMDFLIDAERRNRRRIRMEEWILLALRCLAVALLGLLVARPFVTPSGLATVWGGSRRVERVFVLDDSFSMGYETPTGTPFERSRTGVKRLIESIRRETPDDTVTVIRTSDPSKPLEWGASLDEAGGDELLARLEALAASQRGLELPAVFQGVAEALHRDAGIVNAAVYMLSDFQRKDWVQREPPASADADSTPAEAGGSLAAPLAAWAADDRALRTVFINIGEPNAANLALTGLSLPAGQPVTGAPATVRAVVSNFSDRAVSDLELQLNVGNRPQPSKGLPALRERQTASVDLEADFPRPGDEAIRVELPRDGLAVDDVRLGAVDVVSAIRILVVNGEPSADDYDDEVGLLTTALRPEGEVFSGHEIVVVDEAGLEDVSLPGFHAVVLANVYRLAEPLVESMERFVRQGGGLLVFLGDQVDAESYNTALYRGGEGILPAELGEIVRAADAAHLVVSDRLHPALRAVGREDDPLGLSQVRFQQYFATRLGVEPDSPQPRSTPPAQTAGVIARFDGTESHAAVVEMTAGLGRVILVTTSVDKEWNQWPDHPTFLPVITELLRHVARRAQTSGELTVGQAIEVPVDVATHESDVMVRPPGYPNQPEAMIAGSPAPRGPGVIARWEHTESPGLYQFIMRRREGGETTRTVAVNVDSRESDLSMATEAEVRRAMGGLPFEYFQGLERLAEAAGETRVELWRPVLTGIVLVLMIEQFLAWRWGRRR
jgi:hypothetical protein